MHSSKIDSFPLLPLDRSKGPLGPTNVPAPVFTDIDVFFSFAYLLSTLHGRLGGKESVMQVKPGSKPVFSKCGKWEGCERSCCLPTLRDSDSISLTGL